MSSPTHWPDHVSPYPGQVWRLHHWGEDARLVERKPLPNDWGDRSVVAFWTTDHEDRCVYERASGHTMVSATWVSGGPFDGMRFLSTPVLPGWEEGALGNLRQWRRFVGGTSLHVTPAPDGSGATWSIMRPNGNHIGGVCGGPFPVIRAMQAATRAAEGSR